MFIIFWLINFLVCLWFLLSDMQQNIEDNWFLQYNFAMEKNYHWMSRWEQMVQSWYASLLIINGEGWTPSPQRSISGAPSYRSSAWQFRLASFLSSRISCQSSLHPRQSMISRIMDYQMSHLRLPKSLQDRIREYYSFLWKEHRCIDEIPLPFMRAFSQFGSKWTST